MARRHRVYERKIEQMLWKLDARELLPLDPRAGPDCARAAPRDVSHDARLSHPHPTCVRVRMRIRMQKYANALALVLVLMPGPLYAQQQQAHANTNAKTDERPTATATADASACEQCASFFFLEEDEVHERFAVSAAHSGLKLASFRGAPRTCPLPPSHSHTLSLSLTRRALHSCSFVTP